VEVQAEPVLHDILPEATLAPDALATQIAESSGPQVPALLVAARTFVLANSPAASKVIDAIAQRYPSWGPQGRMLALTVLPPVAKFPALKPIIDQVAEEVDPKVLLVAVIAQASTPEDPILTVAAAVKDPALAKVVASQRERLTAGAPTYSRVGMIDRAPAPTLQPAKP